MPTNPNTAGQTLARTVLASASSAWRALSAGDRAGWANLGAQIERTDSLGQTYTLTGLQIWTSLYRNLSFIGGTLPTTAPALSLPTPLLTITVTATSA